MTRQENKMQIRYFNPELNQNQKELMNKLVERLKDVQEEIHPKQPETLSNTFDSELLYNAMVYEETIDISNNDSYKQAEEWLLERAPSFRSRVIDQHLKRHSMENKEISCMYLRDLTVDMQCKKDNLSFQLSINTAVGIK